MLYERHLPHPLLRPYVEDLWLGDDYVPPHSRERIVPSGTVELVINLRENEIRIYDADRPQLCKRFSGAVVSGAYRRFFLTDTAEEASIMGVHFRPGGAFPIFKVLPHELADAHVDLELLWGSFARELREKLILASRPTERFELLELALLDHLVASWQPHYAVAFALDTFAQSESHKTVRELARSINLSERRFIEVFRNEVGLTPKLYSRIKRFEQVLAFVQHNDSPDFAGVAQTYGYFDQSHLIRDFQQFSGFSPSTYIAKQQYLSKHKILIKRNHVPSA